MKLNLIARHRVWRGLIRLACMALAGASALALSSCGGGGTPVPPDSIDLYALGVSLSGLDPHVGQKTEFYVTDATDFLWTVAVYDPLPAASLSFTCPESLREQRTYNLSYWADLNGNGSHDAGPDDHQWVKPIPASGAFTGTHDTNFTDFNETTFGRRTGDFTINVSGLDPAAVGMSFEVRVIDTASALTSPPGRTIGIYHLGAVPDTSFSVGIPDIINDSTYRVDFYLDENGNGDYDAPPVDHAWRRTQVGTSAGGLVVNFTHDTTYTDIGL
jgi:hypothetical protein